MSYSDALGSREMRALVLAQLVSVAGTAVAAVALTVLVYRRTASPLLASLTFALGFLPFVLGGALLSGLVDRVHPRLLSAGCDAGCAALMVAIAVPGLPLLALFALLLASGILASLSNGARIALTRAAVPAGGYVPARSLLRIASQLAQIAGNAGGGGLLVAFGSSGALLVNAGTFLFSAGLVRLRLADHPSVGQAGADRLVADSLRGAGRILARRDVRRLLLFGWLVPMFFVAPEAVAAPYVASHHGSAALVGWWLVALPIGLIAGDFAGVRLLSSRRQQRVMAPVAAAGFLPYLAFAASPAIPVGMALLVVAGTSGVYSLGFDARLRDAVPQELFARTMTLNSSGLMAIQGIGFTLAGAIAQGVGPAKAVVIAGAGGIVSTVVLLRGEVRGRVPAR
jgi:MFS family permease